MACGLVVFPDRLPPEDGRCDRGRRTDVVVLCTSPSRVRTDGVSDLVAAPRSTRARRCDSGRRHIADIRQAMQRRQRGSGLVAPCCWRRYPRSRRSITCGRTLWELVRGATQLKPPAARRSGASLHGAARRQSWSAGLSGTADRRARRRCGSRPRLCAGHRAAAPRARCAAPRSEDADARRAEVIDLTGVARDHLAGRAWRRADDAAGHRFSRRLGFPAEGYWRGEQHRLADRPGSLERICQELVDLRRRSDRAGVRGAGVAGGPHALAAPRLDGRGRLGEYLQSVGSSGGARRRHGLADERRRAPADFRDSAGRTIRSVRSILTAASTIDRCGTRR